jgi:hypothetical protein
VTGLHEAFGDLPGVSRRRAADGFAMTPQWGSQQNRPVPPQSRPDPVNFVESTMFRSLIQLELPKAVRLQYGIAVVCVTIDFPATPMPGQLKAMADAAIAHLRATDVVTVLSDSCLAVMLVDPEPNSVPRVIHRVIDSCKAIAAGPEYGTLDLVWSAGVSLYPQTSTTADVLHHALIMMKRAREAGGNRLYVHPPD